MKIASLLRLFQKPRQQIGSTVFLAIGNFITGGKTTSPPFRLYSQIDLILNGSYIILYTGVQTGLLGFP